MLPDLRGLHCKRCQRQTLHVQDLSYWLWDLAMLGLVIISFGLFLPIGLFYMLHTRTRWICHDCGTKRSP